jgi:hypothetical protein
MKLPIASLLAAIVAAPLAAQAAQPPARFAVTLQGTIVDRLSYERTVVDEDCRSTRTGQGGRQVTIRSLRPTTVEVRRDASGIRYRPSRVAALGIGETRLAGTYSELRLCRFLPPEKLAGECEREPGSVRRMRLGFRSGRNAILFGRPAPAQSATPACGVDRSVSGGWLHLIPGRIDRDALLNGRSMRVFARGAGTRERALGSDPTLEGTLRTTVRWTLTFRRLV